GEFGHGDVLFGDRCADEVETPCSTVALDGEFDGVAGPSPQGLRHPPDVPAADGQVADAGDDVAGADARAGGGGSRRDARHEHPAGGPSTSGAAGAVLGAEPQPHTAVVAAEAPL